MNPEKRRAGRAIRKHRREMRQMEESVDLFVEYLQNMQREMSRAIELMMLKFRIFGKE